VTYERKDVHFRRAKAEGLRARSAYKLAELDDRHRLFRRGHRVVDLGAWPGGWAQVAAERIGPAGRLVAVDLVRLDPLPLAHVVLITGDVRDPTVVTSVHDAMGGLADVVLSDVAPKLTGIRSTDEARCAELVQTILGVLPRLLRPDGRAVVKVFMGPDYQAVLTQLRGVFRDVKTTRPEATRRASAELYVIAEGFVGPVDNL
jgi:23S rRNA (uridine2552-2'-O)-methyltransferase